MGKPSTKVRVNKVRKSMPFQPDGGSHDSEARGMKAKQRRWMMDGLRAMKAPVAVDENGWASGHEGTSGA